MALKTPFFDDGKSDAGTIAVKWYEQQNAVISAAYSIQIHNMIIKIDIAVRVGNQPLLMNELVAAFPEGANYAFNGKLTSFRIIKHTNDPILQKVTTLIESKGYELTDDVKDYSRQVSISREIDFEKSDYDNARYLSLYASKAVKLGSGGTGYLREQRFKINALPPKFRYCFQQGACLVSAATRKKLEKENFRGLLFLPVDHVPGVRVNVLEDYNKSEGAKPITDLFGLYSSLTLPDSMGYYDGAEAYESKQLKPIEPFDLALKSFSDQLSEIHPLVCSQKFYRFWESNLGDMVWHPIHLKEEECTE